MSGDLAVALPTRLLPLTWHLGHCTTGKIPNLYISTRVVPQLAVLGGLSLGARPSWHGLTR